VSLRQIWTAGQYLQYKIRAASKFKVHSPFVYDLYTKVILDNTPKADYQKVEKQRAYLLRQNSLLETTDFGAGAAGGDYKTRFRQLKHITRHSSISPKFGKLLYRLTEFASPDHILEIGTAVGISAMYIGMAAPKSKFITMEGCAVIADRAHENFIKFRLDKIEQRTGNFNNLMSKTIEDFERLDFVLIDGNHRKEPSIDYFQQILPKLHSKSIVVMDDIHWSKGMLEAWNTIKNDNKVSISIDLFRAGILLFREDIAKENYVLKF
jgi:predicted O-methyltransferase YrrM